MWLENTEATENFAYQLAQLIPAGSFTLHLQGDLGAGKTTLVRSLLHALGHQGNVKSPTYTLVEPYHIAERQVFHFDLYRLADPEELLYLGIEDYLSQSALLLIEWPEQAGDLLPPPDMIIQLRYQADGRQLELKDQSARGKAICEKLHNQV
ncbi:ATPase YjeE, predicted to have essential role in cell wall biosynthesis [Methylophaga frappieri]|uniref:tRNA threonylcarbamoyladenosine biosynthesis protein TsaE n=1 Tax=Methylophaga frappieri (strain ATCC BAA-2434 / DSM 25690 / JAM7) TaxID=754477 RepID=I1YIS2_METFJ|nr:tRNA (adenosine(37)-N6)-threonylcarbamoyltransferase complex ATPase subunit type 1 TsaE [Methylophaga frappieri]AFJ02815.1 ATPase YjeE, predicted to have essential role in cell wall biosynthesis [Methylophaga frappieri]